MTRKISALLALVLGIIGFTGAVASPVGTNMLYLPVAQRGFVLPEGNLALLVEGFSDVTIAYASPDGTVYDLNLKSDIEPGFSPDGRYLQFDAEGGANGTDLMLVDNPNQVIALLDTRGQWLPDSSGMDYRGENGRYWIAIDTLESTLLTTDRVDSGVWSKDSNYFVYSTSPVSGDRMRDIYRVNRDGSGRVPLFTGATDDLLWSVLPDRSIIFASVDVETDASDLYRMDFDGGNVTRLTNNAFFERSVTISRDGSQMMFLGDNEVVLMGTDGTPIVNFPLNCFQSTCYLLDVDWLPDFSEVFFTTYVDPAVGGPYNRIYRVRTDGSETTPRLVRDGAQGVDVSDDGRYLGYMADIVTEGTQRVTILTDLVTGEEQVIFGEQGMRFYGWRPTPQ